MAIEDADDRAAFFDADEFGVEIAWTRGAATSAFNAIFSRPSILVEDDEVGVIDRAARLYCRFQDLPAGAEEGDAVAVAGETVSFRCRAVRPTGDGMAFVDLKAA